jgi:hypothetical protein
MSDEAEALNAVAGQLAGVTGQLRNVSRSQAAIIARQNRQGVRLWIVIIGFALDVVLTVILAFVIAGQVSQGNQLQDTQRRIQVVQARIHDSQISACGIGNRFRMSQRQLWITLIDLSRQGPQPHLTPAEKKAQAAVLRKFISAVDKTYVTLDCKKLYATR